MPIYVYEAEEKENSCSQCRNSFEISQSINDSRLEKCPECGAKIIRVIQAPGLTHSRTDLNYRAKRAGFHALKKVGKGEYEKLY